MIAGRVMLLLAFSRHSNALLGDQKLPSDTSRVPLYAVRHLQTSLSTTAQSLLYPAGHLCARRHSPILAVHTAERRQLFPHRRSSAVLDSGIPFATGYGGAYSPHTRRNG